MDLFHYVYEGTEPYLFISYAHKDSDIVMPLIQGLMDRQARVWFDAGVAPGGAWPDYIAEHLVNSHAVVIMLSSNSLASNNCRKEMLMASNYGKNVIVVYLEPLQLSPGDEMQLIDYQALYCWKYPGNDAFLSALCRGSVMEACRASAPAETTVETIVPTSVVYETIAEAESVTVPPVKTESLPSLESTASAEELYMEARKLYDKAAYREAVTLARQASEMGHPGAQYLLGCLYRHSEACRYCAGPGVSQAEARETGLNWIRTAAENGHPQAQRYIGETEKDAKLAVAWFQKSAEQADPLGLYFLGECCRQGKGIEKDIVRAMDCYLAAARKGHPASATRYRDVLKKASLSERMALKKAGHSLRKLDEK